MQGAVVFMPTMTGGRVGVGYILARMAAVSFS